MENQNLCPVCNSNMNWIKPGVSQRTGKSYNGFFSCPNRCKKPQNTPTGQISTNSTTPTANPRNLDKENFGKCKFGFMVETYKKITEVLVSDELLDDIENQSERMAKRAMRILNEPKIARYEEDTILDNIPF
jgi:hypothetical protein